MAFRQKIKFAMVFLAAVSFWSHSPAEPIDSLRERTRELAQNLEQKDSQIAQITKKLDRLSKSIHALKKDRKNESEWIENYRLQAKLKDAQAVSDRLHKVSMERKALETSFLQVREALAEALDRKVEEQRKIAGSNLENWEKRRLAAVDLDRLLAERMELSMARDSSPIPVVSSDLLTQTTTPEDRSDKLNALSDLEKRMNQELVLIETELSDLRRQRFVRRELAHLMDEEAFFGEQGFIRGNPSRSDKETRETAESATSQKAGEAAPAVATAAPTGTSDSTGKPTASPLDTAVPSSINPASRNLNPSEVTSPTQDETVAGRDPLEQLANQFGIPSEELREFSGRSGGTRSGDVHIRWLEKRLKATRQIVQKIREMTHNLQAQTKP